MVELEAGPPNGSESPFYEPDRKLWFEACEAISSAKATTYAKRDTFRFIRRLRWYPRPVPADATYTELFGAETFFAVIGNGPFAAIWGVEEEPKRKLMLYQVDLNLDPLTPESGP